MTKNKPLVCLDAGHGGYDSGATRECRYEKNDNLAMALAVEKELLALGCCTVLTRRADKYVSLEQRVTLANDSDASIFLSLHRNAFTTPDAFGTENWIDAKDSRNSNLLAQAVMTQLNQVGVSKNRGIKRGNFYVLRHTKMPACLLELGFLSNESDNALFDQSFNAYAKAIAKGIATFLNVVPPDENLTEKIPDKKLYRVQVGAFSNKKSALSLQKELVQKGYQTLITHL